MNKSSNKKTDKIGLMFGSYNPPHLGHLAQAMSRKDTYGLSEVWLMPVPVTAFKKGTLQATFNQKVEMCEILAAPHNGWLKTKKHCENFETDFVGQLQSYKRVLEGLSQKNPDAEFNIVCGDDVERKIKTLQAILSSMALLGEAVQKASPVEVAFLNDIVSRVVCGKDVINNTPLLAGRRQNVAGVSNDSEEVVVPASSTEIREAIRDGKPFPASFPPALQNYVRGHKLYGSKPLCCS